MVRLTDIESSSDQSWGPKYLIECFKSNILGSVVRSPISANSGLNFNPGSFFFWSTAFPRVVFSILFRVSYHQIVDEKNETEFAFQLLYLRSNFALTPSYLNPASNNPRPRLPSSFFTLWIEVAAMSLECHLLKTGYATKSNHSQGHPMSIFGKYLFGRRFEI